MRRFRNFCLDVFCWLYVIYINTSVAVRGYRREYCQILSIYHPVSICCVLYLSLCFSLFLSPVFVSQPGGGGGEIYKTACFSFYRVDVKQEELLCTTSFLLLSLRDVLWLISLYIYINIYILLMKHFSSCYLSYNLKERKLFLHQVLVLDVIFYISTRFVVSKFLIDCFHW